MRSHRLTMNLAAAATQLIAEGLDDPNIHEILAEYYGKDKYFDSAMIRSHQCYIPAIKAILESEHKMHIVLVSREYYDEYKRVCPETDGEARCCIPIARRSYGLRKVNGDLISEAWNRWNTKSAAGRSSANFTRILGQVTDGVLPHDQLQDIIRIQHEAMPEEARRQLEAIAIESNRNQLTDNRVELSGPPNNES